MGRRKKLIIQIKQICLEKMSDFLLSNLRQGAVCTQLIIKNNITWYCIAKLWEIRVT